MTVRNGATDSAAPAAPPADGMVWVPGATFTMGSDHHYPEEAPAHAVTVGGFWIDPRPVTNREFGRFARKTGHITVAERAPDPADYPGARPELLVPFSAVFVAPPHRVSLADPHNWWIAVPGANWRQPQGPGSSIRSKPDHPVVHLAWADAVAYASWAGKEIPAEAEWERAARGGLDGAEYAWGDPGHARAWGRHERQRPKAVQGSTRLQASGVEIWDSPGPVNPAGVGNSRSMTGSASRRKAGRACGIPAAWLRIGRGLGATTAAADKLPGLAC